MDGNFSQADSICQNNSLWSVNCALRTRPPERAGAVVVVVRLWNRFNYPSHMDRVKKHDVVFMYANGVGFVAVGQAAGPVKKLEQGQSGRIRKNWPCEEWRIKMNDWFSWLPDEDAIYWPSTTLYRSKTFFDITDEEHEEVRIAVSKAFLLNNSLVNV
jgi:hypothetical protein